MAFPFVSCSGLFLGGTFFVGRYDGTAANNDGAAQYFHNR
jgi:hypothetical protein